MALGGLGAAHAQSDLYRATLLTANVQLDAATGSEMAVGPTAIKKSITHWNCFAERPPPGQAFSANGPGADFDGPDLRSMLR